MKKAVSIPRDNIVTIGTCFGKFTKGKAFKVHVTCLDYLAQFALYKIWIREGSEMSFLYGNHVLKAHIMKSSDGLPEHQGVVVYSCKDIPLGFATSAKSAAALSMVSDQQCIAAFHQADIGEYLRDEASII
jgi:60S ribosome subunit biogenesis protein NIP7